MRKRSRKTIIRALDSCFSKYIKLRDCLRTTKTKDKGVCITCAKVVEFADSDAGHFIKRGNWTVRYDEQNVHAQCRRCNLYLGGNEGNYALSIIRLYGLKELERLIAEKGKVRRFKIWELEELEQVYKQKYNELYN